MDVEFMFRIIHNLKADFSRFHAVVLVHQLHKLEEVLDIYRAESFFSEEIPGDLNDAFEETEGVFQRFLDSEKSILDTARRESKSTESDETVFLPNLAKFISEKFGEDSPFFISFKEEYLLGHLSDKLRAFPLSIKFLILKESKSNLY